MISYRLQTFKNCVGNILYYENRVIGESRFGVDIKKNKGILYNLWIEKNYRNRYYGSKLLSNTEKIIKKKGLNTISFSILEDRNGCLSNFYYKNNYILENIENKSLDYEESIQDLLFFTKKL